MHLIGQRPLVRELATIVQCHYSHSSCLSVKLSAYQLQYDVSKFKVMVIAKKAKIRRVKHCCQSVSLAE